MKDQVPFTVSMDIEGAIELVNRRSAKSPVDGRDGPAHLFSSPICRVVYDKGSQSERFCKSE
jgi:hypothetical protein